jgi:hypothetical protein
MVDFTPHGRQDNYDEVCPELPSHRRYRCRYCHAELPGWLPHFQAPDGAMLLSHLSQAHPDQVKAYLDRMPTDQTWPRPPLHLCGLKPTVLGPQVYANVRHD